MYAEDSFFTLTMIGRIGLIAVSACLTLLVFWLNWRLARRRIWPLRLLIAASTFVGFLWLAPQVYYTYYIFLLDGLEWQNVVGHPPTAGEISSLLTFQARPNLSFHAQGLLGWALVLSTFIRRQA